MAFCDFTLHRPDSLAEACEQMGDIARAKALYRKALEIDPQFSHAAERLAALGE